MVRLLNLLRTPQNLIFVLAVVHADRTNVNYYLWLQIIKILTQREKHCYN